MNQSFQSTIPALGTRARYVWEARQLLDTPYRHAGRTPNKALDCVGQIIAIARATRYPHKDFKEYSRKVPMNLLPDRLREWLNPIPLDAIQAGSVGCFWFDAGSKNPQHCGLFTGATNADDCTWIHTGEWGSKKTREQRFSTMWRARLVCAFDFRGVV